jgi:hypothetical protein
MVIICFMNLYFKLAAALEVKLENAKLLYYKSLYLTLQSLTRKTSFSRTARCF